MQVIQQELTILSDPSKIFIVGLSQGYSVALSSYLEMNSKLGSLGGVFLYGGSFCCSEIEWKRIKIEEKKKTPILVLHGTEDPVIPVIDAHQSV
jgi:predicted esterase